MKTDNKDISTPEYWDDVFLQKNTDSKVDNLNTKIVQTIDRIADTMELITDNEIDILDIASAHATLCKRLKVKFPNKNITACDHSKEAKVIANFLPYIVCDAYSIPFPDKSFDLIICTQAMEYMTDNNRFLIEAKRLGRKMIISVPNGEMQNWSQLRIYDENNFKELIEKFGAIEYIKVYNTMILAKIIFHE